MSHLLPLLLLALSCRGATVAMGPSPTGHDTPGTDDTGDAPAPTDDTGTGPPPADTDTWLRQEISAPGSITFTELHYHPESDGDLEWIELYNPMVLDMDVSGWALGDGVDWTFPEGAVVPAGGYIVVAANPALLEYETGFADALGPYDGRLDNDGERVELHSNGGRLIDTVGFGDDDPWPVHADGSGFSLAKAAPGAASDHAENWTHSAERGGTPGASNGLDRLALPVRAVLIAPDATWAYDASGAYPADDWADPDYDDSAWDSGGATFYAGQSADDVLGTAWVTADNYFALYLGQADGSDLRLVGEDTDGSWTTVEEIDLEIGANDHLYVAAWELTGDAGSPQMTIAEVELPDDVVGTDATDWEWVLGPVDTNPGALPGNAPPTEAAILDLIDDANAAGSWDLPAVEASRSASPWGSTVSGDFTDAAAFIWGDTFDSDSVTNADDTFALFRSQGPIVPTAGSEQLDDVPTTTTFRTPFTFDGSAASTALELDCTLDDGAVFFLNGVEVLRQNMPAGTIDATTLARTSVTDDDTFSADIDTSALVQGRNILAVEVHQAEADDTDLRFGCALTAETWSAAPEPTVRFNEVAAGTDTPFWAELVNASDSAQDLGGLIVTAANGEQAVLAAGTLAPGALLVLDDLGLTVDAGTPLFLSSADGGALLDGVRIGDGPRARAENAGPWRVPTDASPGDDNPIDLTEDVVIHEILYHRAPLSRDGAPITDRPEEWIELTNRGEDVVDLGGWQLADAVAYTFPDGTTLAPGDYLVVAAHADDLRDDHPDITVLGDYRGSLGNSGDRILLRDAVGNPADEVRYYDGGRWPDAADGGGSSLELRDPWADNAAAEAWAASDEGARAAWTDITIRGEAGASAVGPDGVWEELVLGLLDSGEVLIDDLSVVQDPDTDPVELIPNGSFDDDTNHWRMLGTHRHATVVPDPDDPANAVLRLVATGPSGHMHNHAETTLLGPIGAHEYEISFRARWVSGSNQLHSRLYFNRLPTTTLVPQPSRSGTPGAANSVAVANLGPTFDDLRQDVAVPAPDEPVLVSVSVADPDGVAHVTLWSSVNGGAFQDQPMTDAGAGQWEAHLDGQAAGALVQLYVEATDDAGFSATFPADGPDSRAMYIVDDGLGGATGLHDFRILMTEADTDWLHQDVNLMSNDLVGATVVYGETEVFYNVGVRLKGSQRGRPQTVRLGYGVRFADDQPFRGSHTSVMIDRSEGVGYGQREMLTNLMMTRAGSVSGEYNDLVQLLPPRADYVGAAELQLDRFSNLVLGAQFADGGSGARFEYELIYYPYTTDDGTADGLKLPQPDSVIGTSITDLGDDKEAYRWTYLIKNNARQDDYAAIMDLCQVSTLSDADFLNEADAVIDVEQWLRAFAFATLSGATDQYGGAGSQHNAQFYVRPEDGRVLYFPHDLDFFGSSTMSVVANNDLARLLQDPVNKRSYYGHLNDIIATSYNATYMAPWCAQLGALLPGQNFTSHCSFLDDRSAYVLSGSSASVLSTFPSVDFQITTEGGDDFTVDTRETTLQGDAWVDVRHITLNGASESLDLTWLDDTTWQITIALAEGDNDIALTATDLHGATVGRDAIVVTADLAR